MNSDATTDALRDDMLDALDRALVAWPDDATFGRAVAETVARHGYAAEDVERQLRHVVLRCRGRTMRLVLDEELGVDATFADAPASVLVLAAGRMPGLVVEGIAASVAVGARALVRPSRDETVLPHLLGWLREREPDLAARIEVVALDGGEPPWDRADAAIVFGSDATIALVRDKLSDDASRRVAAYGSRQAIAVVAPGADVDPSWARRLAGDVLAFRQAGCMSPSWLYVLAAGDADAAALQEAVGRELALARDRHVAPGVDAGIQQRRSSDADVLGAIAAGLAPNSTALHAGDARLTVVHVRDEAELITQVEGLGSLLQTAVIATSREDRAGIAQLLLERTGITRICLPGQAHEPEALWPQDGIGRVAPLLGR
jgi:hypothetical protein